MKCTWIPNPITPNSGSLSTVACYDQLHSLMYTYLLYHKKLMNRNLLLTSSLSHLLLQYTAFYLLLRISILLIPFHDAFQNFLLLHRRNITLWALPFFQIGKKSVSLPREMLLQRQLNPAHKSFIGNPRTPRHTQPLHIYFFTQTVLPIISIWLDSQCTLKYFSLQPSFTVS